MAHWNLFDLVTTVILRFPALFSHFENLGMSTLITIIITYYLLIIIVIIIPKNHNNYWPGNHMSIRVIWGKFNSIVF